MEVTFSPIEAGSFSGTVQFPTDVVEGNTIEVTGTGSGGVQDFQLDSDENGYLFTFDATGLAKILRTSPDGTVFWEREISDLTGNERMILTSAGEVILIGVHPIDRSWVQENQNLEDSLPGAMLHVHHLSADSGQDLRVTDWPVGNGGDTVSMLGTHLDGEENLRVVLKVQDTLTTHTRIFRYSAGAKREEQAHLSKPLNLDGETPREILFWADGGFYIASKESIFAFESDSEGPLWRVGSADGVSLGHVDSKGDLILFTNYRAVRTVYCSKFEKDTGALLWWNYGGFYEDSYRGYIVSNSPDDVFLFKTANVALVGKLDPETGSFTYPFLYNLRYSFARTQNFRFFPFPDGRALMAGGDLVLCTHSDGTVLWYDDLKDTLRRGGKVLPAMGGGYFLVRAPFDPLHPIEKVSR